MRGKHLALVKVLMSQNEWMTAKQLAKQLQVSDRSIKNYIGEINYQEENLIEASKNGYRIHREQAKKVLSRQNSQLPETPGERVGFILTELLSGDTEQGVDLYELGERIFVSYETLRKDVVKARKKAKEYGLYISVANSVIRLEGRELDKRKLLSAILYEEFNKNIVSLELVQRAFPDYDLEKLRNIILSECKRYHYYINDYAMVNLVLDISISMERIRKNCTFRTHIAENRQFAAKDMELVNSIAWCIEETFSVSITGLQLQELAALILSHLLKVDVNALNQKNIRTFVPLESMEIVEHVLEYLNENYYIDTTDEEFVVKFAIHIHNLLLRLRNHYTTKNPLTDHIKNSCPLIFECAVGVACCLSRMTGFRVDEDEIAYIALHIGGNLENYQKQKERLICVLVCPQYYDMSDVMSEKISREFSDSLLIRSIITNVSELVAVKTADLIISTVTLQPGRWEHVVTVNPFLRSNDLENIRREIFEIHRERKRESLKSMLLQMTSPELFCRNDSHFTQEEILSFMIDRMEGLGYVGPSFREEVKEREKHSTTAFGRLAVPHALALNAFRTGIYILLSEKPIAWDEHQVNLILLFAVNREDRTMFHEVFDNLIVLLLENHNLEQALSCQSYEEFVDTLTML